MPEKFSLEGAFAAPQLKRRYVRRLFATIADRSDLITVLLSFGRDRHWKARLLDLVAIRPGWRVLDLACGTGDLAFGALHRGASTVGLDITLRMVQLARAKESDDIRGRFLMSWLVGDMTDLPIDNASVDAVTTGYGLRNVPDLRRAIAEIHRVLRPGGWIGSLDFDQTGNAMGSCDLSHLPTRRRLDPRLGHCIAIRHLSLYPRFHPPHPGARGVAAMMRDTGFTDPPRTRVGRGSWRYISDGSTVGFRGFWGSGFRGSRVLGSRVPRC
jgi:demethylmenaquinone methyltransferase/2-methoxy-6-polyprenyl-1,4-benzoquinol methylase